MSERHRFSVTNFVLGVAMVGFAVLARYGTGRGAISEWPWLLGLAMVALGISLVLGALRTDTDTRSPTEAVQPEPMSEGMAEVSNEFQSHDSTALADPLE